MASTASSGISMLPPHCHTGCALSERYLVRDVIQEKNVNIFESLVEELNANEKPSHQYLIFEYGLVLPGCEYEWFLRGL